MASHEDVARTPIGQYIVPQLEKVDFGPGSTERLPEEVRNQGGTRPFLVTTGSLINSPVGTEITSLLGDRLTGTFSAVHQHTPSGDIVRLTDAILSQRPDIVVSLGGGSVIDATKAAVLALARDTGSFLPHIALPTTLSASEFSPLFGVTDERTHTKSGGSSPFVQPQAVILDAALTRLTPDWLWYGSGIRALDHAVETVYAPNRQPATTAAALEAIRLLFDHLPSSGGEDASVPARQQCMIAAWLSFFGVGNITLGLSHALGREIGARYSVPHGYTSAVLLPRVMAFLLPETEPEQARIAEAAGVERRDRAISEIALEAPTRVEELVARLGLPRRLRDLDVPETDIEPLAAGRDDVLHILREAW